MRFGFGLTGHFGFPDACPLSRRLRRRTIAASYNLVDRSPRGFLEQPIAMNRSGNESDAPQSRPNGIHDDGTITSNSPEVDSARRFLFGPMAADAFSDRDFGGSGLRIGTENGRSARDVDVPITGWRTDR